MALAEGTVWEIRTTGSQVNGGGFYNRSPGTSVDYSQQDAAQLTVTDLATDGAGTGLSSATGGFTAAMVGNIVRITGGTLTAGWYEITAYTDTNNVTIDRSAGLSKTGGTGNVGGAWKYEGNLNAEFFAALPMSSHVWIQAGTHTGSESTTVPTGDVSKPPLHVEGYKTVRGDNPTGDDRPLLNLGNTVFYIGSYTKASNLRFTGTMLYVVSVNASGVAINIKVVNTSEMSDYAAFYTPDVGACCVKCEGEDAHGTAFKTGSATGDAWHLYSCYAHDSVTGIRAGGTGAEVIGCIVDTCTTGITMAYGVTLINNTIYNCTNGVSLTEKAYYGVALNNIITACTNGMTTTATYAESGFRDYNCLNNTNNYVNFPAGAHDIVGDPLLTDPANKDFTLGTGSPCFASGLTIDASVGL